PPRSDRLDRGSPRRKRVSPSRRDRQPDTAARDVCAHDRAHLERRSDARHAARSPHGFCRPTATLQLAYQATGGTVRKIRCAFALSVCLLFGCSSNPADTPPPRIGDEPGAGTGLRELRGYLSVNQEIRTRLFVENEASQKFQLHLLLGNADQAGSLE